jgi:hypothetical protein
MRTIRVEATLRDRRSKVVSRSTVGKATKSLKLLILIAVKRTMIDRAMLKVKSTSKRIAGKGTSIIIKTSKTRTGIAPCADGCSLVSSKPKIFIS